MPRSTAIPRANPWPTSPSWSRTSSPSGSTFDLKSQSPAIDPDDPPAIDLDARFLYGAPAAGLAIEGETPGQAGRVPLGLSRLSLRAGERDPGAGRGSADRRQDRRPGQGQRRLDPPRPGVDQQTAGGRDPAAAWWTTTGVRSSARSPCRWPRNRRASASSLCSTARWRKAAMPASRSSPSAPMASASRSTGLRWTLSKVDHQLPVVRIGRELGLRAHHLQPARRRRHAGHRRSRMPG